MLSFENSDFDFKLRVVSGGVFSMKATVFDFLCSALMNSRTFLRRWWGVFFSVVVMLVSVLVGGDFFFAYLDLF